jgi:hypothetical protein
MKTTTKSLSIFFLIVFLYVNSVFSQKLDRMVILTLKENEILTKASFSFQTNEVKYLTVLKNKLEDKETLVINGEKADSATHFILKNSNINIFENTLPMYGKEISGEGYYFKINNKEYGPYEYGYLKENELNNLEDINNYSIVFLQMKKWFIKLPDDRIAGPFNISQKSSVEIYYPSWGKSYLVNIFNMTPWGTAVYYNGDSLYKNHNCCEQFSPLIFNKKGNCIFREEHNKCNLYMNGVVVDEEYKHGIKLIDEGFAFITPQGMNINGTLYNVEGADSFIYYCFNNQDKYVLEYIRNNKMFVNVNGEINGPYDNPQNFLTYFDGGTSFNEELSFCEMLENRFYDDNDEFFNASINNKNDYTFAYRSSNGNHYVNINGKIEGPYQRTWSPKLSDNGTYAYWCKKNDKEYIVINGKEMGPYEIASEPIITKNGYWAYWYQNDKKQYFNINGKIEGPYDEYYSLTYNSPEIIDPYSNYRHFNIDEKGNYIYTYRLDNNIYTCINGEKNELNDLSIENGENDHSILRYSYKIGSEEFDAIVGKGIIKFSTDYTIPEVIKSKDEKYVMTCAMDIPYVMINNQKFGNGEILAAAYNKYQNLFRWSVLEDKELVVYEYTPLSGK